MQLVTHLVGANFRGPAAKEVLRTSGVGTTGTLVRDADNAYDANAVQVHIDGVFVGFVPAKDNGELANLLDANSEFEGVLFAEGHTPTVTRCEILDFHNGDLKPTLVIEVDDGFALGTIVRTEGDKDDDYLSGTDDEDEADDEQ